MKKKMKTMMTPLLALALCLTLVLPFFATGCGTALSYSGKAVNEGTVGEDYSAYVGTASGSDMISYAVAEGSSLPAGLTMDADGFIEGIPTEMGDFEFTVVASADGSTAEAKFTMKINEGALSYSAQTVKVARNVAFERSIAAAVTSAGSYISGVTYALKEGSVLPDGITLDPSGTLAGTPASNGTYKFFVTASANDCVGAEAEITLNVVNSWLDYEDIALRRATVGVYYTGNVAGAYNGTGSSATPIVSYRLDDDSAPLPAGLEMTSTGVIYGVPEEAGTSTFTVRATASGFAMALHEFELRINPMLGSEVTDGKITMRTESIDPIESGTNAFVYGAVLASASNRQTVTYEVTGGSLPEGLTLYPDGTLAGRTTDAGEHTFTVTASAPGCEAVSREFTLNVTLTLVYDNMTLYEDDANDLYVGEECSLDIAAAEFPAGSSGGEITYEALSELPEGLTLSPDGKITGTPVRSVKMAQINVRASAEGFTSKTAIVSIHIEDALVSGVTRFEAEYTDLRGKTGSGYSGSAIEEAMINTTPSVPASRSKDGKTSEIVNGGYYIPFTYGAITLTFEFESSAAVSGANLSLFLDSEVQTEVGDYTIIVNGETVAVSNVTIPNSSGALVGFEKYDICNVDLVGGANVIEIVNASGVYAPAVDAMELGNLGGATLSWRPALYNLPKFTQA